MSLFLRNRRVQECGLFQMHKAWPLRGELSMEGIGIFSLSLKYRSALSSIYVLRVTPIEGNE
jgi:hypothetical protein